MLNVVDRTAELHDGAIGKDAPGVHPEWLWRLRRRLMMKKAPIFKVALKRALAEGALTGAHSDAVRWVRANSFRFQEAVAKC